MTVLLPAPTAAQRAHRAKSRRRPAAAPPRANSKPGPQAPPRITQLWIHPEHSVSAFRDLASRAHLHVDDLSADQALSLMLDFYRNSRSPDCEAQEEGDILQCEWGLSQCGATELFHFELSRQFTECGTEDESGVSRLTIGMHYKPTFTLRAIVPAGELTCRSREELDEFEQGIRSSDAFWAIATIPPAEIALEWNPM